MHESCSVTGECGVGASEQGCAIEMIIIQSEFRGRVRWRLMGEWLVKDVMFGQGCIQCAVCCVSECVRVCWCVCRCHL